MKKPLTFLISALLALYADTIHATNYYFSSSGGNDSYTSTQAQNPGTPWQSLDKLNSFFPNLKAGDSVLFKCGDTFYGKIIVNKSGLFGFPIVLGSYGAGAKPVITGFTSLTSWTNVSGNIWESTGTISTTTNMPMVTVNGLIQPIGRYPKSSYLSYQSYSGTTSITSNAIGSYPSFVGGECVVKPNSWTLERFIIGSQNSTTVTFSSYVSPINTNTGATTPEGSNIFFFQNSANACTQQGDWYYNKPIKKLGMYSSGTPSDVKIAMIDTLISINGYNYISINDLNVTGANIYCLFINNSSSNHDITINNCSFSYCGVDAIFFQNAAPNHITITNNNISYAHNNGIYLNDGTYFTVTNNVIGNIGMIAGMGQSSGQQYGIAYIGNNSNFQYNEVYSIGYIGVHFYGANITIQNNYIHETNQVMTTDGGSIYTFDNYSPGSKGTNRKILNNIIINSGCTGIYLDGDASYVLVQGNTVAGSSKHGFNTNSGTYDTILNNTFYNNNLSQFHLKQYTDGHIPTGWEVKNNIFFAKTYSLTASYETETSTANPSTWGTFDYNYYCRPILEPDGVVQNPCFNTYNYNYCKNGGIIEREGPSNSYSSDYSLDKWKAFTGQEIHSKKSPKTVTNIDDIRFEYNATQSPKTINLGATYIGVDSTIYSGSITLQPYTSVVLIYLSGTISNQSPVANAGPDQNFFLPTNSATLTGSGTDADGSIASYQWTKISGPSQFAIVSPTQAQTVINNLAQGVYLFQLTVTDNLGATGKDTVQITVNSANIAPTANAGPNQNITLPTNTVTLSGSGTDADGSIASYQWTKISGPSQFTIASPTQAQTVINNLAQGVYLFQLTVTDNLGATGKDTVQVTVNSANIAPTANAGPNQNITLPTNSVTLSGSGSDADGTISSYQWTKISGPSQFTIVSPSQAQTVINNLIQGTYQFQLTVMDNQGATATSILTVTVSPAPNQSPTANAGPDQTITLPTNSITVTGSGSDPDGSIVSYQWTKISGPSQFTIVSSGQSQTVINNLAQGTYQFQLTVTDNQGATGRDSLQVVVNPANQPPVANAGPNQNITLPTNSVSLSGSASDPDGSIVSYQWTKVSGPSQFTIVSPSQAQTTVNNLVQGIYQFQLTVTDNQGATGVSAVTVTVNAAPNQAPTANAGADQNITLPVNSVTLSGSGTDPDGSITAYRWSKISGPNSGSISNIYSASTTLSGLVQGIYVYELRVTDNSGAYGRDTVQVTVNPANIAPTADAGLNQNITLPANSVTVSGSGADADGTIVSYQWSFVSGPSQYNIVSPAQSQTVINNLAAGTYQFMLTVTDNSGATGTDIVVITVNASLNQPPIANAGVNQNITLPLNSITITGSGTDADGSIVSYQWSKISGPSQFTIVSPAQSQTVINNLVQGTYEFQLTVTDNQGATGIAIVTITVNPAPNQAPLANAGADQIITLPANSVTFTGTGSDPDGNIISYQWSKISGPAQFTIVSASQAQTVVNNLVQGTYQFQLTVTDNSGATGTDIVIVTVNPAPNKAPSANAGADQIIYLPANSVTLSGSGWDSDGTISTYQWSKISGPSQYTIVTPSQAQTAINNLAQGTYQFELKVTDNQGLTGKDTVQVIVKPANIAPSANAGPDQNITLPTNSVTLNGSGSDPDGSIASYQWTKISGPSQFTIVTASQAQTAINNLAQGVYQFQFTVTDNLGATGKDTVTVTVNSPNQPPAANAGYNQNITLPTNSVTLSGSGSDPDGSISSYQWSKISGPAQFNIVSSSQAQTVVNNLVQGTYQFQLKVTDNQGATATATVTVTVNPAPNQLPVANAGPDQTITLPVNTVSLSGSGTDPDGTIASYSWSQIAGPTQFSIASPMQAQTAINNLVQGVYVFQLTVTDNSGAAATDLVSITVNAAVPASPPTANAGADQTLVLPTSITNLSGSGNTTNGSITTYSWTQVSGPTQSVINSPSQSQTSVQSLAAGVYLFELTVTDNNGLTGRDTVQVTVENSPNRNQVSSTAILYPNPASTIINIEINGATEKSSGFIKIYNAAGYVVYQEQFSRDQFTVTRQIDVSKLANGMYFVNVTLDLNTLTTLKFVKY